MVDTLRIGVEDNAIVEDRLYVYRRWFNGLKRFVTVKMLPPHR